MITVLTNTMQNILHFYSQFTEILHFKVDQGLSPHPVRYLIFALYLLNVYLFLLERTQLLLNRRWFNKLIK